MEEEKIKRVVREAYGRIASEGGVCCLPSAACCGPLVPVQGLGRRIGYTGEDLASVPEGANLGLGCGTPLAGVTIKKGDTVVDLGAGGGLDCFLAANRVGPNGRVIGIDMTPEMVSKARENARQGGYNNVEFRLGEIENLPIADSIADWVISNCVINLSVQKDRVFQEAFRVLKPGGTLLVSDLVLLTPLPAALKNSLDAYIGCVAGATAKDTYLEAVAAAGFTDIQIIDETVYSIQEILGGGAVGEPASLEGTVASIRMRARKPGRDSG